MDIKLIFSALVLHSLALITPGPDFILTVRNTLKYGRLLGFATSLGFGLGIAVHVSYSIGGLALVLEEFPHVYHFIRYLGATYLIWLGVQGFWSMRKESKMIEIKEEKKKVTNFFDCLGQGFLTNILNPKATLFILGIFASIGRHETPLSELIMTGIGMVTLTIMWFSLVAGIFSIESVRSIYLHAKKSLNLLFGSFFIIIGLVLILN